MISAKQLTIYNAIIDILRIYADTEIGGQYEINNHAVAEYLDSLACCFGYFDCVTKEQVYDKFTQDILNGYPVYEMLILPDWTRSMIIKEYAREAIEAKRELEKTYKCYTCEYFEEKYVKAFGGCVYRCHSGNKSSGDCKNIGSVTKKLEAPVKSCKHYKKKDNTVCKQ